MVKTGVVEGVVKTASADNAGDPIGTAAKCIASAKAAMAGLKGLSESMKKSVDRIKEDDGNGNKKQ